MTTQKEKYNGWTNYETWVVNLWMDNDEGSQTYWHDEAVEAYENNGPTTVFSHAENATLVLMERIKSEHEENTPTVTGVYADLLNAALSEVNWHEIAKHLIDEALAEVAV